MFKQSSYSPKKGMISIKTLDMHTGGEPLRVIMDGFPELEGESVLDFRKFIKANYDHLRKTLLFEPRGHADMYGVVITPSKVADFGVVFMHNEGYSTMCGHATLAIAKLAIEARWIKVHEPETTIKIEAPCGIITAKVIVLNDEVIDVSFINVPSFVVALEQTVHVEGLGKVQYDLAYGGAFYAFVDAEMLGLSCTADRYQDLIKAGMQIKHAIMNERTVTHPEEADLSFLYGTIFIGEPLSKEADSRNVCVFADGEVDRSPTGSGVSARAAIHHARGQLKVGEQMVVESIIGSKFTVSINELTEYFGYNAVIPEVIGTSFVTGRNEFLIDPDDPLRDGFILR